MSDSMWSASGDYLGKRKRKAGRKALKPEDRRMTACVALNVSDVRYAEAAAEKSGNPGNLSAGIRACIRRCMEQEQAALDAIKQAAERRDQNTVQSQGSVFDD